MKPMEKLLKTIIDEAKIYLRKAYIFFFPINNALVECKIFSYMIPS